MLIVNLYAGPGAGKSTLAAAIFAQLKDQGVVAELVTEFAKDLVWENNLRPLACQPYIFGEQLWRIERLKGAGVEVVVTDSPIRLAAVYAPPGTPLAFISAVHAYANQQTTMSVFLGRVKPYQPLGRLGAEGDAQAHDEKIARTCGPFDLYLPGRLTSVPIIVETIKHRLSEMRAAQPQKEIAL